LRKTVVRIPGPSWMENRWILKTSPLVTGTVPSRLGAGRKKGPLVLALPHSKRKTGLMLVDFRSGAPGSQLRTHLSMLAPPQ
jgi:hypothetical protein